MRIKFENEILDQAKRVAIIQAIEGRENILRKHDSYKRYRCYKDKTNHYVVDYLLRQFESDTVEEMRYALSNISIVKKVIDKLARVYSNGVVREISGDGDSTKKIKELEKSLDINSAMKKTNRFLKLEKNVDLFIKPCPVYNEDGTEAKWDIKLECLLPHLYDVVEDHYNRQKALCVVLSDYTPLMSQLEYSDSMRSPQAIGGVNISNATDKKDSVIADSPADQKNFASNCQKLYVFWSKNYHFTCDAQGQIVVDPKNPENKNPLGVFNHINFASDQDGAFWSEGGMDLIDGAILINALITHTIHIGTVQGYGQFYATGENLPRSFKIGPTKAIIAEYKKDEQAEPKFGFLNANPQLDSMRSLIEMYIALYLTTNNLSTSGVSTQLASGQSFASGVALLIDKAESLEDVQDQRQIFIDREPEVFEAINAALLAYGDANLVEDLQGLALPEGFEDDFVIRFHEPTTILTEKEKLEVLKMRQELGIDSMISLLMKEDPSLDEAQAEERLRKIVEQKIVEKMLEQQAMKDSGVEYDSEDPEDPEDTKDASTNPQDPNTVVDTSAPIDSSNTPIVGDTAGQAGANVQQLALNGAQVTALVDIVEKVAAGTLPRDSAINMIVTAFNVQVPDAEKILGSAGKGFKVPVVEPVNQGGVNAGNGQNAQ